MTFEIMLDDLKVDIQKEILLLYGEKCKENLNLDIFPLFILEIEEKY